MGHPPLGGGLGPTFTFFNFTHIIATHRFESTSILHYEFIYILYNQTLLQDNLKKTEKILKEHRFSGRCNSATAPPLRNAVKLHIRHDHEVKGGGGGGGERERELYIKYIQPYPVFPCYLFFVKVMSTSEFVLPK